MLNNLSEQIRNYYQHAEDCAAKAAAETDPQVKQDFLDWEKALAIVGTQLRTQRTAERLFRRDEAAVG
jgi:hypothetical protein